MNASPAIGRPDPGPPKSGGGPGKVLLEARGVTKRYGGVEALRGADFDVREGEVVGLVGDNGAGKSTLVKVLSGTVRPNAGEVRLDDNPIQINDPHTARELGIETVYQDLALAPDLDPAANLFLEREIFRRGVLGRLGVLDKRAMRRDAAAAFVRLGIQLPDVDARVDMLSGGQRQAVAVARAVSWSSRIVFMDEPTAALGVAQTQAVLDLIRRVRDEGTSIVLISHNMADVFAVCDRIEVLRLGCRVAQFDVADADVNDVVKAITGAA